MSNMSSIALAVSSPGTGPLILRGLLIILEDGHGHAGHESRHANGRLRYGHADEHDESGDGHADGHDESRQRSIPTILTHCSQSFGESKSDHCVYMHYKSSRMRCITTRSDDLRVLTVT